jgi:tRNA(Ile)-lysidine synthase
LGNNILPNKKTITVQKITENIEFGDGNFYLDYHKIPQNAVWRTRRDGDVFCKLGSRGKKKLNDYFTDKKLSTLQRENTVLLASGNNVLLVLDHDVSDYVKIDGDTIDIIKISKK